MPKSDWTFYVSGPGVHSLVTSPPPPVGLKWLQLNLVSGGDVRIVGVPDDPPYAHANVTRGRWRTLLRYDDASLRSQVGLLAMCSQENMLQAQGGASYAMVWQNNAQNGTRTLHLAKFINGIEDMVGSTGIIATSPNLLWSLGTTYALEWSWYLDVPNLGGILLSVALGTALDFSDLAPVPNLTDVLVTTNVLTSAVTVGFYAANWNSNSCALYLDQTSLATL